MLISTNRPFNVIDHSATREFLKTHVNGRGSLVSSQALYPYLDDIYQNERNNLEQKIAGKKIVVIFDETADDQGNRICNIFSLAEKKQPTSLMYISNPAQ